MPSPTRQVALRIDLARARLLAPAATGWPRTLGGSDVYLAMRARIPGMTRRALDEAVDASRLQVIPAVRGCIHLVPRAQVPLVLRVAEEPPSARSRHRGARRSRPSQKTWGPSCARSWGTPGASAWTPPTRSASGPPHVRAI